MKSLLNRKIPPILWNQLKKAIWLCENAGLNNDNMFELLKIYRNNQVKYIDNNGITYFETIKPSHNFEDLYFIKPEFSFVIEKLDDAFQEIHKYLQHENVDEFIAKAIVEKITTLKQSKIASKARKNKWTDEEIDEVVNYLDNRKLKLSDNKKAIYIEAKERFSKAGSEGFDKVLTDYQLNKAIKRYNQKI